MGKFDESLARWVQRLIDERGLTQEAIADLADYHQTTIGRFLTGNRDREVGLAVISAVSVWLGIEPWELLWYIAQDQFPPPKKPASAASAGLQRHGDHEPPG